jgi:imidazolonepropionase-like amidohydrolase
MAGVVKEAKDCGAGALKLYSDLTSAQIKQLTAEGHKQGLQVWAHAAVYPASCEQIIDAGVDCISHYALLLRPEGFSEKWNPGDMVIDEGIISSGRLEKLLLKMRAQGTYYDPTVIRCNNLIKIQTGSRAKKLIALGDQAVRRAHELGIPIIAGTDTEVDRNDAPGLFYELKTLVDQVGLNPLEALQCATLNGAALLGLADSHGTIEVNKTADIVMLAKNPLQQIDNLRSITHVIKNGKIQFQK